MKIQKICETTGLSDRTIRFYIQQGLINPSYTENYLGRKSFDFSQKDIDELNNIAVLRKFDFTIEEIKEIIQDFEASKTILASVKARIEHTVSEGQEKLLALSRINPEKNYNIEELANELLTASASLPDKKEKPKINILKSLLSFVKSSFLFIAVWFPVFTIVLSYIVTLNIYSYPVFIPKANLIMLLLLVPPLLYRIICKFKKPWTKIGRMIAVCLCIVNLFFSEFWLGMPIGYLAYSQTTDFVDYRDFDADCLANRSLFFQKMFPIWPHYFENVKQEDGTIETVYLDAHYYYRYIQGFDYTFDIYAEWPLNDVEYTKEVERVSALFSRESPNFVEMDKGDYHCLIYYEHYEPFTIPANSYEYYIFAYNDTTKTVRYIFCDSLENGADQPYYLQLDW